MVTPDEEVNVVGQVFGAPLALLKRKFLIAWFLGFLGAVATTVGHGWIEE